MNENQNPKAMLVILFGTAFIAAFNENIINVALTDMMDAFAVSANTANWLVTGYMIVTAVVVGVVAFLLRRFNLRAIFFGGAGLFIAGSALAMVAPNFPLLLACRLLQALGTGVFIPTMMNTVLAVAPRKSLGVYLSIGGCCITFGPAFGPVISGLMITLLGWRFIFAVPLAAMMVLAVLGFRFVYNFGERQNARLDVTSLLLSAFGLTALVYGLSQITSNLILAVVGMAVGVVLIALFARRQRTLEDPLLNLSPLHNPRFTLACVLVVVSMMTTFSMSVLLPLYFQGALGATALVAGALILIPILAQAATSVIGGRVMDHRGEWPLLPAGFLLMAVGLVLVSLMSGKLTAVGVVIAAAVAYAGVGFSFSPSQTAGLKQLPREMNPFGVGIMSTFIQISAALGPSLFVGILSTGQASALEQGASAALAEAAGFSNAVLVAAIITVAGLATSLVYVRLAARTAKKGESAVQAKPASVLTLADVMKREAFTVSSSAPVYEAVESMLEHHTSGLPVVDENGRVVGFISDGDIMKSIADKDSTLVDLSYSLSIYANDSAFDERVDALMRSCVMDIATTHVISVEATLPIERVCTMLGERRIKKVPVLRDGALVGTVSRTDITRQLMNTFVEKGKEAEPTV